MLKAVSISLTFAGSNLKSGSGNIADNALFELLMFRFVEIAFCTLPAKFHFLNLGPPAICATHKQSLRGGGGFGGLDSQTSEHRIVKVYAKCTSFLYLCCAEP